MFTNEEQSILQEFQEHLDGCDGCQRGPLSMCATGEEIDARFQDARISETDRRARFREFLHQVD